MKYAVVENGVVTNIIVASENYVHAFDGEAIRSSEAQIGWTYKDGVFSPPVVDKDTMAEPRHKSQEKGEEA
ncbi:hypothetical protein [Bartonella tribocorum]|uniref:Uncharacterized protein n=1 Tax=Bartonella tribocorum (strain DSM 28219 / CCUG 45778 / CIP 105476 / IBS 506) TaxID=382640 RepID=A9IUT2_BART1|nr:hypothetical protein [Bartonella tribocorum]CAK01597.1 hypothetical protein predicted by Glimmer/Critica [Bartonella tribocorum CIP 105476]CAK01642.1 hypothetical protein predicted by Glimmer/Critica [Bartonella tribocorum CIP 105476]CAK01751.1 hypothetical protein predicted by Glimmer/Critica [Bartonella tribocorum CIP 105476]CAK02088.1 hypothetical protein predicted by Glimmer/Critica [Bartonella tribocorum CIP 105476]CAK02563.1 hypothetical protein predicted by Glimmer/Critica [Bartonell